ncbi:MAG: DNA repair protein RecN [Bacteroidota bacterium]|nr:DNA repair protein RecN [Bacteroidota bacterium]
MLKSLFIKNYALIEEISVEFERGLNIITGETGAGKTILIDALSLLLGERASTDVIRKGEEKAVVEGVFVVSGAPKIATLLKQNEYNASDELIVRREISAKGQSRCFINDTPAPLSLLKEIGDALVDLHGQHDHQSLLRAETHVDFLDDFGDFGPLLEEYRAPYRELLQLYAAKRELQEKEQQLREKKSLYEFQMSEIDAVNPQENEEEQIEAELKKLENAEKLFELTSQLYGMMYDGENSLHDQLGRASKQLDMLNEIDAAFAGSVGEAKSAEIIVEELSKFLHEYKEKIEFNPERLETLHERLGKLILLKKKYGGSLGAVLERRKRIGEECALAENFESELSKVSVAIQKQHGICSERAQKLSAKRSEAARKIEKSILASLAELGIANGKFSVRIERKKIERSKNDGEIPDDTLKIGNDYFAATSHGIDSVEFYLSTNAGEDVKPLVKVASGGEVSRVMLALKSTLAQSDRVPLMIFDEIDTGVSGRIGQAVGMSLKKLASTPQIIAITHLPQIAGLADTHFAVEKIENGKRTTTRLRKLMVEERVHEIAKLMSGAEVTAAGLKSARELMGMK